MSVTDAERNYVRRFVGRLVGEGPLAEDLVQEALLKAHRKAETFAGQSRRTTWLAAVALNVVRDHLRKRESREEPAGEIDLEAVVSSDDPERAFLEKEMGTCVMGFLMALPKRLQTVLALHDMGGASHAEISAVLGITEGNARVLLSRARAALREKLKKHCRLSFGSDPIPCVPFDPNET